MKIEAHIICWNEMAIAPFVMQYWQHAGVDRLIIHDNHSTDGSTELLQKYPFVEIRQFDSNGELNDYVLRDMKNNCWKGTDADWVFVGDFDEVPYCKRGLRKMLADCPHLGIIQPCGYQLVSWQFPKTEFRRLLHYEDNVRLVPLYADKVNLFQPRWIKEINYGLGAHQCNPVGADVAYLPEINWFHLKNLGVDYLLNRNKQLYNRLPERVKLEKKIATHYLPGMDIYNVANSLAELWTNSEPYCNFDL